MTAIRIIAESAAANCAVRLNANISDFSPKGSNSEGPAVAAEAVQNAYALAAQGRRQAALAANQLEGLFHRNPDSRTACRRAAVERLSGGDLAKGGVQAASQAILKRLNEALAGDGLTVTKTLMDDEGINRLRIFRQQVRDLLRTAGQE